MPAPLSAANATLLLIVGADRDDQIKRLGNQLQIEGSSDIFGLLDRQEPFHRLHVTRHYFRQQRRADLSPYRCLLNLITEPEQNSKVLENLRKLARETPANVINRPEAVLRSTRDQVARRLAGTPGLVVPRVVRLRTANPAVVAQTIGKVGLQFPLIVRQTGTHTGHIVGRFDSVEEVQAALVKGSEHIATEFVDFRSPDGYYRKYRVFFIGQHIILRHMLVSDEWNIHAKDRMRFMADRPDLLEEEERLFAQPEGEFPPNVIQTLRAVRERMELDFFGMDFGIASDGRVVLFEANASMNFFPFLADAQFAYVQRCWAPAQRAFREMLGLEPAPPTATWSTTDLEPA